MAPMYTHAHTNCQREHMVILGEDHSPLPRGLEPLKLHNDLKAVARAHRNGKLINRSHVASVVCKWYRVVANPRHGLHMHVWLHPHPRVDPLATVFGALKVTPEDVRQAVQRQKEDRREMERAAGLRRQKMLRRAKTVSDMFYAMLCVWMGRGKTRWRTLAEMQTVHEDVLESLQVHLLLQPKPRRTPSSRMYNVLLHSIALFGRVLDLMAPNAPSPSLLEWAVGHIKLSRMFEGVANDLLFVEESLFDAELDREASVYARTFCLLEEIGPAAVRRVRAQATYEANSPSLQYSFQATLVFRRRRYLSSFVLSVSDVFKLKYATELDVSAHLADRLPEDPPRSVLHSTNYGAVRISEFVADVLRVCFSRGSGMARAKALNLLVCLSVFEEINEDAVFSTHRLPEHSLSSHFAHDLPTPP